MDGTRQTIEADLINLLEVKNLLEKIDPSIQLDNEEKKLKHDSKKIKISWTYSACYNKRFKESELDEALGVLQSITEIGEGDKSLDNEMKKIRCV